MMMNSKKWQQHRKQQQRKCGRRWRVFSLFLAVLFLIVLSSMLWPRTPLIRIEGASLLSPAKITETSQGAMLGNVQFESQWTVNFTVDNRQNWLLPTRLVQMHVLVKDALTGNVIGKGLQNDHPESLVLDPRAISTVQLGVSLDYQARDVSDTTFASLKKACIAQAPTPTRRKRSHLVSRADGNTSTAAHDGGAGNKTNGTTVAQGTNHAVSSSNNITTTNNNINNQTLPHPPSASFPPSIKEHEPLSLLFWVTLHIWGLISLVTGLLFINDSITHINPLKDCELVLRSKFEIPAIENLGGTKDLNDTIDFTNNDLRVLGNFPRLNRLKHLLLANNCISKIELGLGPVLPELETIVLTNNSIEELSDIEPLSSLNKLYHLVLLDNPVTKKEHYRLYVIYKLPTLRVLDFNKIKQKERDEAHKLFQSTDGQDNALAQSITDIKSATFEPGEGVPDS
ncbi:unnamed protein product [Absidia cylindrospora]